MIDLGSKDPVAMFQQGVKDCIRSMSPRLEQAVESSEAYQSKSPIVSGDEVSVAINHLRPIIEVLVPRIMRGIHPQRPFFPIRTCWDEYNWMGDIYEDALDKAMNQGGYKRELTTAIRWFLGYGTAYMSPYIDTWSEDRYRSFVLNDPMSGGIQGYQEERDRVMQDGLMYEALPLWAVLVPYAGSTLKSKDYRIIQRLMTVEEAKRRIESNPDVFKMPKGKDSKSLKGGVNTEGAEWFAKFEVDTGRTEASDINSNVGVWYEFYSEKRWEVFWNGDIHLTPDGTPRMTNIDRRMPPLSQLKLNPGLKSNQYFGEPIWEWIKDKALVDELFLSLYGHKALMDASKTTVIDKSRIDPERFNEMQYRGVIEVQGDVNGAFTVRDYSHPGDAELQIHGILDDSIRRQVNIPEMMEGTAPAPRQTATIGQAMLSEGQINVGSIADYVRETYSIDMAAITLSLFGEHMSITKLARYVGWPKAMQVKTPNPYMIPGGFYLELEDMEAQEKKSLEFQKLEKAWSYLSQTPQVAGNPAALSIFVEAFLDNLTSFSREKKDIILGKTVPNEQQMTPPMGGASPQGEGQPPVQQGIPRAPSMVPPEQMGTPELTRQANVEARTG